MRKTIVFLLVFCISAGVFLCPVAAEEVSPVSVEFSPLTEGEIKVTVYGEDVTKLTGFNIRLFYDNEYLKFCEGAPGMYDAEEEIYNFNGFWDFGELYDGTGCTGVFMSMDGVSRKGKRVICEFVLQVTGRETANTEITAVLREMNTDDEDFLNDVSYTQPVTLANNSVSISESDLYSYKVTNSSATVTGCYFTSSAITVPETIDGYTVEKVDFINGWQGKIIEFPACVKSIGALPADALLVFSDSANIASQAKNSGNPWFQYKCESFCIEDGILFSKESEKTDSDNFYTTNIEVVSLFPIKDFSFYGTGTEIILLWGENQYSLTLCIEGDLNGDSVCDVLDGAELELALKGFSETEKACTYSADLNGDKIIDVQDFTLLVNKIVS